MPGQCGFHIIEPFNLTILLPPFRAVFERIDREGSVSRNVTGLAQISVYRHGVLFRASALVLNRLQLSAYTPLAIAYRTGLFSGAIALTSSTAIMLPLSTERETGSGSLFASNGNGWLERCEPFIEEPP